MDAKSARAFGLRTIVAVCIGSWCFVVAAQGNNEVVPAPLTVNECISHALERHPAIKAQRAGVGVAFEQTQVAKSYFLPDASLAATYTYIDEPRSVDFNLFSGEVGDRLLESAAFFEIARQTDSATAIAALNDLDGPAFAQTKQALAAGLPQTVRTDLLGQNFVTSQLRVIQPLWTGGKITARYDQSQSAHAIARYDVCQVEQGVTYNVSRAYLTVLLTRDLRNCAEQAADYAAGVAEVAASVVAEGDRYVSDADVRRAQAFSALFREQAVGIDVAIVRTYAALRLAMGMSQQEDIAVSDDALPTEQFQFDQQELTQYALARRPELMKVRAAVRIASLGRDVAKSEYFPQVGAFASYNTINDDANFPNPNDTTEWAAGVGATMPLYTGGRIGAQVRQANYLTCQAVEHRNLLTRVVEQEVADAYLELEEMQRRLTEAATAVTRAEQALESFRALFAIGIEPDAMPRYYENLLTTRLLLLTAQVRYYQTLYGYNVALSRIRLAAGMPPLAEFDANDSIEDPIPRDPLPADSELGGIR